MSRFLVAHTDAVWLPPGETEKAVLARIGAELIAEECTSDEQIIRLAADADAILNSRARITATVLRSLRSCKIVSRYGIGVDNIDAAAATECGIVVANVPDFCVDEVSDHAMALLLAAARQLFLLAPIARGNDWSAHVYPPIGRLRGRKFGAVGFGRIGRAIARKARAFGLKILAHDPYVDPAAMRKFGAEPVSLEALLHASDFVSLHLPLTAETRHLFGEQVLRQMKPSAVLINCARGAIVDEGALVRALREGWIAGAALDVQQREPPAPDNPLLQLPNVVLTPHCGAYSEESFLDLRRRAAEAIVRALTGRWPKNVVNPQVRERFRAGARRGAIA